jgi:hypothetical protein
MIQSFKMNEAKNNCSPLVSQFIVADCSPLVGQELVKLVQDRSNIQTIYFFKRNPIFPKNWISWALLGTRFEKSDFSKKIGFLGHFWAHDLKNPIFPKNRISWALSG